MTDLPRQQRTIARSVRVEGFGYWSGRDVTVELRPAPVGTGIVFVRHDLSPPVRIAAVAENRIEAPRRTTLAAGTESVEMVEHVLAALAGLRIDNCEVWVDQPEMPGLDGSCLPLVDAISRAGTQLQEALRPVIVVSEPTRIGTEDAWVEARPAATAGMFIQYRLDYGRQHVLGQQTFQGAVTCQMFVAEIAPARTFITKQEAEWLRSQGLAQRPTYRDLLVFDDAGPMENTLRFPDECVRHKVLDLIGDLALAGCDLHGRFVAHRSGHRLNAELVTSLLAKSEPIRQWPGAGCFRRCA